jgi:hypothetical protein
VFLRGRLLTFLESFRDAESKENDEDCRKEKRKSQIGFHQPKEVDNPQGGRDIHTAMQYSPPLS